MGHAGAHRQPDSGTIAVLLWPIPRRDWSYHTHGDLGVTVHRRAAPPTTSGFFPRRGASIIPAVIHTLPVRAAGGAHGTMPEGFWGGGGGRGGHAPDDPFVKKAYCRFIIYRQPISGGGALILFRYTPRGPPTGVIS